MRNLSEAFKSQINSQNIDDVFLVLMTINHADTDTFYLVSNTENIIHQGQEFTAFPFNIELAPDEEGSLPVGKLEFSNVSQLLLNEIRQVTSPLEINIKLVLASNPDFVEIEIDRMLARQLSYNESRISFRLAYDDILGVEVPSYSYSPLEYKGLF